MSELIQKHDNRATIRWKLLTGVSALALTAYVSSADVAIAGDTSQPPIWITLDGQFAQQKNDLEVFNPDFLKSSPFAAELHLGLEKAPPNIWNKGAAITFQPEGSDWVLSAGIQYGKNSRKEERNQITPHAAYKYFYNAYQDPLSYGSESHTILDFQVGKDVGLGRFGSDGRSVVSAGVRFAQFKSATNVDIKSQPTNFSAYTSHARYYHFYADFAAKRKFSGIGPSLSWDASADIAGNPSAGRITLDWGVNGSLLFGRQSTSTSHRTKENKIVFNTIHPPSPPGTGAHARVPVYNHPYSSSRSKRVTVPNLGGFAGVSIRYEDAKISFGYRADMFFGAIDGGIDARKTENRGFNGPYLSLSVGIGD